MYTKDKENELSALFFSLFLGPLGNPRQSQKSPLSASSKEVCDIISSWNVLRPGARPTRGTVFHISSRY